MKRTHKVLLVVFGLVVLVASVCFSLPVVARILASGDYVVRAEFDELPPNDKELEQWLLGQPGVSFGRVQREDKTITAVWGYDGTSYRDPVTPILREQFESFGYKGLLNYEEEKRWYHDR